MSDEILIRAATVGDVPGIGGLISGYAERGLMLFRSHAELYEAVRDFFVAEVDGKVVGVCGLEIVWGDLAEVRSLAVAEGFQGKRIGSRLVEAVAAEAVRLGIQRIFALTYEQRFFERLGFVVVEKDALPLKVWSVCIKCPKREKCDEIAMVRTLMESPNVVDVGADAEGGHYSVPTQLTVRAGKDV